MRLGLLQFLFEKNHSSVQSNGFTKRYKCLDQRRPIMHTVLRVKRVREKYEAELRELECSERAAVEKQQELRKQQMEAEGELIRLQAALRQKEQEVEELTQVRS